MRAGSNTFSGTVEEFARTIGTAATKFGLDVVVNDLNAQDLIPLVHAALTGIEPVSSRPEQSELTLSS